MRIPWVLKTLAPACALVLFAAACATRGEPRLAQSFDGVSIEYEVAGEGEVTVLLVHGWSGDRSYWRKQISALSGHYRVAALDLAGHGASGFQRSKWTIKNYAKDVIAVADALAARNIVLVGHSMGGPVALEAARRLKDRVAGVIGVDTFKQAGERPTREEAREFWKPLRDDFSAQVLKITPGLFFISSSPPDLVQAVSRDLASAPPRVAVPSGMSLSRYDSKRGLRRVRNLPVTLINSTYQPTDMKALSGVHPRVRLLTMDGVGHFVMLEAPERFNTLLRTQINAMVKPEKPPAVEEVAGE
ncbi:MAG: alpha/beta fold hydrolase [Alphaproteobacteria bacterium]